MKQKSSFLGLDWSSSSAESDSTSGTSPDRAKPESTNISVSSQLTVPLPYEMAPFSAPALPDK